MSSVVCWLVGHRWELFSSTGFGRDWGWTPTWNDPGEYGCRRCAKWMLPRRSVWWRT